MDSGFHLLPLNFSVKMVWEFSCLAGLLLPMTMGRGSSVCSRFPYVSLAMLRLCEKPLREVVWIGRPSASFDSAICVWRLSLLLYMYFLNLYALLCCFSVSKEMPGGGVLEQRVASTSPGGSYWLRDEVRSSMATGGDLCWPGYPSPVLKCS